MDGRSRGPSVDGGNPRNLIHRVLGHSVSVCSTRVEGRGAEQFEGHQKKQESSRRVLSLPPPPPSLSLEPERERVVSERKQKKNPQKTGKLRAPWKTNRIRSPATRRRRRMGIMFFRGKTRYRKITRGART